VIVVLGLLFALSGAAGLFYEAVWSRYLSLFVGHDAYAQVLTLVIFLGGMGLGALMVSRRSTRIADPLFAYALVELVIGVIGLLFHDGMYLPVTGWAYDHLFPALSGGPLLVVSKWTLAGLLILPQSLLLGATFPLMSAGVIRRMPAAPGRTLSLLYFANSLGAAAGVLVAGFALYAMAGLPGTLAAAAMLNLVVALGAVVVARVRRVGKSGGREVVTAEPERSGPSRRPDLPIFRLLLWVAAGTAIASFIYEVGWIRMLSLVMGSSTHSFELMLSAFILGLALGAWWIRKRADRLTHPVRTLALIQLAMGALALASLPLYLRSFEWTAALIQATARTDPGYALFTVARYLICLAIMLPATFCAGMTLPLLTRILLTSGSGERAIGIVYGVNTLGSIAGAALAGLVLFPLIGLKGSLVLGGGLDMMLGVLLLLVVSRERSREWGREPPGRQPAEPAPPQVAGPPGRPVWGAALLTAGLIGAVQVGVKWDQSLLSSGVFRVGRVISDDQRDILFHADGRTATVHATRFRTSGIRVLSTNGKPDGSLGPIWFESCNATTPRQPLGFDDGTQTLLALLLLAHAPRATTGAVIGHGTGLSSHFLLASPLLTRLNTIEIEPAMLAGSRIFYPVNRRVFDDPRSRIVTGDARAFFAASRGRYDLILSEPSNPWVSGASGLFTTEFYRRVRGALAPGGVFGQWLHTYELSDPLVLGVLAALHENFADYRIFLISGGDLLVVAAPERRLPRPDWSVVNLPDVQRDLCRFLPMTAVALDRIVIADRASLAPLFAQAVRANSDFYPVLDLGAEEARFRQKAAVGLANLGSGVVEYLEPSLLAAGFDTATTSGVASAPRVKGMLLAAQLRHAGVDSGWADRPGAGERYLLRNWTRQAGGESAPSNWRSWTAEFWTLHRALHGGGAPPDSSFFVQAGRAVTRPGVPEGARAAVRFGEALARRQFVSGVEPAEVLVREAEAQRPWIPVDDLLDGAVRVFLAAGAAEKARRTLQILRPYSTRAADDLRLLLLGASIQEALGTPEH
jgi:spermidine synthase